LRVEIATMRQWAEEAAKAENENAEDLEATRAYADRVEAEVVALRGERAAVVAWLREAAYTTLYDARAWDVADAIERGEHHSAEKDQKCQE
jgi:hypothetical protein